MRHGWGPARGFTEHEFFPGTVLGEERGAGTRDWPSAADEQPSVILAAGRDHRHRQEEGLQRRLGGQCRAAQAEELRATIVPDNMELVVTRNYGLTANEKVNELVEGLAVAVLIVVALLTLGLGWRHVNVSSASLP